MARGGERRGDAGQGKARHRSKAWDGTEWTGRAQQGPERQVLITEAPAGRGLDSKARRGWARQALITEAFF